MELKTDEIVMPGTIHTSTFDSTCALDMSCIADYIDHDVYNAIEKALRNDQTVIVTSAQCRNLLDGTVVTRVLDYKIIPEHWIIKSYRVKNR